MIVRKNTSCPGCGEVVTIRVAVGSTDTLRFYVPCPLCRISIRGHMRGQDPSDFRLELEGDVQDDDGEAHPTVTVNPFFPSRASARDLSEPGGGMMEVIMRVAGEKMMELLEVGRGIEAANETIPEMRRLLEYYDAADYEQTAKYLKKQTDLDLPADGTYPVLHSSVFQLWQGWLTAYVKGATDIDGILEANHQVTEWHLDALKKDSEGYGKAMRQIAGQEPAGSIIRNLIAATTTLMACASAWKSGYLRNAADTDQSVWDELVLFQDEFNSLRDAYQRTFEACCSSLWPAILMRNASVNGSATDFSGITYKKPGDKRVYEVKSLKEFNKLSNAYKLDAFRKLPNMDRCFALLDNKLRNDIGHASAHHDLQKALIVSDKGLRMPYFDLVGRIASLFGPLSFCILTCRQIEILTRMATAAERHAAK